MFLFYFFCFFIFYFLFLFLTHQVIVKFLFWFWIYFLYRPCSQHNVKKILHAMHFTNQIFAVTHNVALFCILFFQCLFSRLRTQPFAALGVSWRKSCQITCSNFGHTNIFSQCLNFIITCQQPIFGSSDKSKFNVRISIINHAKLL